MVSPPPARRVAYVAASLRMGSDCVAHAGVCGSKEIQELQRDLAQLQQQVRDLQRSQDEKFAALQVLVQQAVDNASKANTAVAVIQSGFQQNIRDTESKVVAPVVGLSSRMDQVSTTCARSSRRFPT